MNYYVWENISCKYILKKIFSNIKVSKALEIIKINKRIRSNLEISLFHYHYYYCCTLFKTVNIESINDILHSHYLQSFSEDVKYDLALNLIKNRKLFKDEYAYLNIDNKISKDFIQKIKEKQIKNDFNFIIGNIEEKNRYESTKKQYNKDILDIISPDVIDKILFDFSFIAEPKLSDYYQQNIKFLHIDIYLGETYNISFFDSLEYLSITLDSENKEKNSDKREIKIIITEKQIQNIKTLKIIESINSYYTLNNIIFETENKKDKKYFKNLKELHINEALLNKIKFNSKKLQKLNIIYDFRDRIYSVDYLGNSFVDLLEKYSNLNCLNISLYYINTDYAKKNIFIEEIFLLFFIKIQNIENYSFNFWNLIKSDYEKYCFGHFKFLIKILPNKKFILKGNEIPNVYKNYFKEIEKIDLQNIYQRKKCCLYIEENSSISSLKKIIINRSTGDTLYLPIKSFSSLNYLELNINNIYFQKEFPLFSKDSSIRFNNLEYISLNTETTEMINALASNFTNIPNLRFLSIICNHFYNTTFPYLPEIISKINVLKKLHTLIIKDDYRENRDPDDIIQYYSIFPELKKTNIKFCCISYMNSK